MQIYEYLNPHFPKEESTKFVGGCVRDSISGFATEDIDLATKLLPEKVIEILNHKNIKTYNHAIKYGVVAAKVNNLKFETKEIFNDGKTAGIAVRIEAKDNKAYTYMWTLEKITEEGPLNGNWMTSGVSSPRLLAEGS